MIKWIDKWGSKHSMSTNAATEILRKFYDDWPGGFDEIESMQRHVRATREEALAAAQKRIVFRHKKSGRLYQLLGPAHIQSDKPLDDMAVVQVYHDVNTTGELWVREAGEFNERFEKI